MNIFDLLIVQPIFNVLAFIYGIIPGIDFGVSIILFTIVIRLVMWPLVKKQLHQTKMMRTVQPELKKIKAKTKGNKQLEGQLMMELYREKGVNPYSSFGLLLLQLPVLIALYQVIRLITTSKENIVHYTYGFLQGLPHLQDVIAHPQHFNETLFGVVNLAQPAFADGKVYWPVLLFAILAAGLQYVQSKQLAPDAGEGRKLRDILKEQAAGKDVDQSEVSALVTSRTLLFFPLITLLIAIYLPGALVLYYAVTSLVAVIQQHIILSRDEVELEALADVSASVRAKKAIDAEVVNEPVVSSSPKPKKKAKKRRK